jgi:hypothetical protein
MASGDDSPAKAFFVHGSALQFWKVMDSQQGKQSDSMLDLEDIRVD